MDPYKEKCEFCNYDIRKRVISMALQIRAEEALDRRIDGSERKRKKTRRRKRKSQNVPGQAGAP
jgi:hypothetical protein